MRAAAFPSNAETFEALRVVARVLHREWAYLYDGTYHFTLGEDWSVGVTPESAGRLRVALWRSGRSQCTVWTQALDHPRLEELVEGLATGVVV